MGLSRGLPFGETAPADVLGGVTASTVTVMSLTSAEQGNAQEGGCLSPGQDTPWVWPEVWRGRQRQGGTCSWLGDTSSSTPGAPLPLSRGSVTRE